MRVSRSRMTHLRGDPQKPSSHAAVCVTGSPFGMQDPGEFSRFLVQFWGGICLARKNMFISYKL